MKNANPVFHAVADRRSRLLCVLAVAVAAAGLIACAREKAAAASPKSGAGGNKTIAERFPIKVGEHVVRMQLAVRPGEMQRGLMERRDLGRDEGMIFVYDRPQAMSFWMKNTPTALDIGFFNRAGILEEVYPLYPFDEKTVASRSNELQFALEMNQGWFRENNVKPGARLDLPAFSRALQERGFDPKRFGL